MAVKPTAALNATAGLAAMLDKAEAEADAANTGALHLRVDSIRPKEGQPRTSFDDEKLQELANSIEHRGLIEPVVVRKLTGESHEYELVAGERRWRAHKLLKRETIPAVIRAYEDVSHATTDALVENIQREDLTAGDEANAVEELIVRRGGGRGAIDTVAKELGKTKQWVHERHQLATAPQFVRDFILSGRSTDRRGLYDLTVLASKDADLAQQVIDEFTEGGSLRKAVADIKDPERRAERTPPAAAAGEQSFRLGSGSADTSDADPASAPRIVHFDRPETTPSSDSPPAFVTLQSVEGESATTPDDFRPLESPLALPGDDAGDDTSDAQTAAAEAAYAEGPLDGGDEEPDRSSAPTRSKKDKQPEKPSAKKPSSPPAGPRKLEGARVRDGNLVLEVKDGPILLKVSRAAADTLRKALDKLHK